MFDGHGVVAAEGLPAESFHPGAEALSALAAAARVELFTLFPELAGRAAAWPVARPLLTMRAGRPLSRQIAA